MDEGLNQSDTLRFASLVAHQMKSPLAAIGAILKTMLGGYAGPLTMRQEDLLARAGTRCEQAMAAAERMLAIAEALGKSGPADSVADLAKIARRVYQRNFEKARERNIALSLAIEMEPARVRGLEGALAEVLEALLNNAMKYTPDNGRARIRIAPADDPDKIIASVADSGMGIPEQDRDRVFEPFYRAPMARGSTRPGTGLGLTFVNAVVQSCGGGVWVEDADLGGAEVFLRLPAVSDAALDKGEQEMAEPFRVVIVGGVAAGPKVASRVHRLRSDAEVTVLDKGEFLAYAGCGLPYYISGVVKSQRELMSTPLGAVRDPVFFQQVKQVRVMSRTEALEIDRAGKRVRVRADGDKGEFWLDYDKLVLTTGATPNIPKIPNVDLPSIFTLHGMRDAEGIRAALAEGKAHDVVIVGGGLLGVTMTEALAAKGCRVTIVEKRSQTLSMLDWEMARLVEQHLQLKGVKVLTETTVKSFERDGKVERIVTDQGVLPANLVILGTGVRPNVALAEQAGLEIGTTGALKVDEHMRTSDPDIYAAGDCVECRDLILGKPCYVPLGSTANKQGRVAAANVCGGDDVFPGILGTTVCKVFDYCVARTGLTEADAKREGFDVISVLAPAPDRAHYMPTAKQIFLKLVVETPTGRLLGAQAVGPGQGDKRIDVAAMAITANMTVDQLANVDLSYAPPYSPAMDNIITAANIARNKLNGHMVGISPMEVRRMMDEKRDFIFLDARTPAENEQVRLPGAKLIPLGSLRGRLDELPKDKEIVTFGRISIRGYEAALILKAAGYKRVRVMDGGVEMWPYEKIM